MKEFMKNEQRSKVMTSLLVGALLFPTLTFGQSSRKADAARTSAVEKMTPSYSDYLIEINAGYNTGNDYIKESQAITHLLTSNAGKNPVLIDDQGYARDMVLQSVAARLTESATGKRLFRINWGTLFSSDKDQNAIDTTLADGNKKYDHLMKPDLIAPGNKIVSAVGKNCRILRDHPELKVTSTGGDDSTLMQMSGTSMSTPVVSGAAALLLQLNPKLTPNMVKMLLEYTAQQMGGYDVLEQGAGELNVEGAVRVA